MARSISVFRRRANLVDLFVRQRPGIASYRFKAGTNFDDGSPATFQTVPAAGMASPGLAVDSSFVGSQFQGCTRFRFDPDFYTANTAAVKDSVPLFIKIAPISTDGTVGADEAYHMVLPYNSAPNRPVIIKGTAPNQASLAASLELQLPMLCSNWEFQVSGAVAVFVAFEPTGQEWTVNPIGTNNKGFEKVYPNISQIFVRGNGATSVFSAVFTERNNPIY